MRGLIRTGIVSGAHALVKGWRAGGRHGGIQMRQTKSRRRSGVILGSLVLSVCAAGAAAPGVAAEIDPAAACEKLAALTGFPITPTQITSAKFMTSLNLGVAGGRAAAPVPPPPAGGGAGGRATPGAPRAGV